MESRRTFIGHLTGAAIVAWTGGCNTSIIQQVQTWVPVAITAFDGVITIINPAAGSAIALAAVAIDALWKALQSAISAYKNGNSTLSSVIAAIQAVMNEISAFTGNLPPGLQTGIKLGLSLLVSTLQAFLTKLSPTAVVSAQARTAALGVPPAKDKADFVHKWNRLAIKKADGSTFTIQ